jgi:transcriptional regulator with XRE-family HTH domain
LIHALESAREDKGLSRLALSRRLGMYDNFIQKVEKGDRMLDAVELIWVARTLGVDPRKLIEAAL